MITKTIKHNITGLHKSKSGSERIETTTITWKFLGITIVKKTLYYPEIEQYEVNIRF